MSKLPLYNIYGTAFEIDVVKEELRELKNSSNTLSFRDMIYKSDHYEFRYDTKYKNLALRARKSHPDTKLVQIPQMVTLDPEGIALKYAIPVDEVSKLNDLSLILDPVAFNIRMAGRAPMVDIAGDIFHVNLLKNRLDPAANSDALPILLADVEKENLSAKNDGYSFLYDAEHKQRVSAKWLNKEDSNENILLVSIPPAKELDPVGYSVKHQIDVWDLLRKVPMKIQHEAKTAKWSEVKLQKSISQSPNKPIGPRKSRGKGI